MADDDRESAEGFPPFVFTEEQKRRWVLSAAAARRVAEQIGGDELTVFLATRSLHNSDIPTDPPDEENDSPGSHE